MFGREWYWRPRCEVAMSASQTSASVGILVVNEIESEREEIVRALEAEGFRVTQASSAASAVREIWEGTFIAAVIPTILTGTSAAALSAQLHQMAPEIETVIHGKNDELPR